MCNASMLGLAARLRSAFSSVLCPAILQVYKVHKPKGGRDGKLELIAVKHDVHGLSAWHEIVQQVSRPSVMACHGMECWQQVLVNAQLSVCHWQAASRSMSCALCAGFSFRKRWFVESLC